MSNFINTLEIKNFKSIKHLQLDCKRVNVLIGKPNVGKSNVLEALGLICVPYYNLKDTRVPFLSDKVRYKTIEQVFYDKNYSNPIEISTELYKVILRKDTENNNFFWFTLFGRTEKLLLENTKINRL